jgi:hypothetical protein
VLAKPNMAARATPVTIHRLPPWFICLSFSAGWAGRVQVGR